MQGLLAKMREITSCYHSDIALMGRARMFIASIVIGYVLETTVSIVGFLFYTKI